MKKFKWLLPAMSVAGLTAGIVPVVSCGHKIPDPENFATDSWETVIKVCDDGYEAFAKAYCNYKPTSANSEADAITAIRTWIKAQTKAEKPATRIVEIPRYNYTLEAKVRLIDVDHDELADGKGKAKFTFEFANVFDLFQFDKEGNVWHKDATKSEKEVNSYLRQYLSEVVFDYLPKELKKNIKTVKKYTSYEEDFAWADPVVSEEKLFPLSLTEMKLSDEDCTDKQEGSAYEYYTVDGVEVKKHYVYAEEEEDADFFAYWLRSSAKMKNVAGITSTKTSEGIDAVRTYSHKTIQGIAPGFCI